MRKKDYVLIAGAVWRSRIIVNSLEGNAVKRQAKLDALRLVACDLAGTLYEQNQKFDREKFLKLCGF